jgi:hypothetical protein
MRGGMAGSFWESYSAMDTTQGVTTVLGVAEKPTGVAWEGLPNAARHRTGLWGQLTNVHRIPRFREGVIRPSRGCTWDT